MQDEVYNPVEKTRDNPTPVSTGLKLTDDQVQQLVTRSKELLQVVNEYKRREENLLRGMAASQQLAAALGINHGAKFTLPFVIKTVTKIFKTFSTDDRREEFIKKHGPQFDAIKQLAADYPGVFNLLTDTLTLGTVTDGKQLGN